MESQNNPLDYTQNIKMLLESTKMYKNDFCFSDSLNDDLESKFQERLLEML